METGELTEEDGASQQVHQPPPPLASNFVAPPPIVTSGPASLPPMAGGNEQQSGEKITCGIWSFSIDTFDTPGLQRMVVMSPTASPRLFCPRHSRSKGWSRVTMISGFSTSSLRCCPPCPASPPSPHPPEVARLRARVGPRVQPRVRASLRSLGSQT